MQIQVSNSVPMPTADVFHLLRDDMPALVPFLFDIERIEVTERREDGDEVTLVNVWYGSLDKVPGPLKRFVKAELLSWKDHARWSTAERTSRWKLEPRLGDRVFACSGTTRLTDEGDDGCRISMDIDLEIHPEHIPGIPRLVARSFRGQLESLIAGQLKPNLANLATSVRRYAEARS